MPRASPAASEYDSLSVQYSISGPGGRPKGGKKKIDIYIYVDIF